MNGDEMSPPPLPGPDVQGLPDDVEAAYREARTNLGVASFTSCELICRKLLMHIAVERTGSKEGGTFAGYIDDLVHAGYVTPPMQPWVDKIKANANRATHDIAPVEKSRAESTLTFTTQLLRTVYEMTFLTEQMVDETPDPE